MPRRSRPQRWALVVVAAAGTFVGTAAAAQPAEHHPTVPPVVPPTVPVTQPSTTLVPTTPPTTTTVPDTTVPTTTTPPPPPPTTTEPPIQEPTTTTTEAPSSTVAPPTTAPVDDARAAPALPGTGGTDDGPGTGVGAPAAGGDAPDGAEVPTDGNDEVALPSAEWLFSDGRALVAPSAPRTDDTRPVWLAVLLGLAAGIGLTATASVVVGNHEHRKD